MGVRTGTTGGTGEKKEYGNIYFTVVERQKHWQTHVNVLLCRALNSIFLPAQPFLHRCLHKCHFLSVDIKTGLLMSVLSNTNIPLATLTPACFFWWERPWQKIAARQAYNASRCDKNTIKSSITIIVISKEKCWVFESVSLEGTDGARRSTEPRGV